MIRPTPSTTRRRLLAGSGFAALALLLSSRVASARVRNADDPAAIRAQIKRLKLRRRKLKKRIKNPATRDEVIGILNLRISRCRKQLRQLTN